MGLDTTHGAWHGAYSAFNTWRMGIAKYAGIPLNLMEGFYVPGNILHDPLKRLEIHTRDIDRSEKECITNILNEMCEDLPIKWSSLKPSALHFLLYHSDCDGDITWRRCKKIADELTKLMELIPADLDCGGHIGNFREKTQTFIDGCLAAYNAKENLEFH